MAPSHDAEDLAVADSTTASIGDTLEEAGATEEGSAQPEGSAESPPPLGDTPGMTAPLGIDVKKEAKDDTPTVGPDGDGSTEATGVTNVTLPDAEMKRLTEELEQQKKTWRKETQDLEEQLAKAGAAKRLSEARAARAEAEASAAAEVAAAARLQQAAAEAAQVDLNSEPDTDPESEAEGNSLHNEDRAAQCRGGCQWCKSTWEDGIDLTDKQYVDWIWEEAGYKNWKEMKTVNDDRCTPDWEATAASNDRVTIDNEKWEKTMDGLCQSLESKGAWCDNAHGGRRSILNDWEMFKGAIKTI